MDRAYLKELIVRMQTAMHEHAKKFADNPAHNNCSPRFSATLDQLQKELHEIQKRSLNSNATLNP